MIRAYLTPQFCDALITRLKAGDDPAQLRVELNIGSATMARYVSFAKARFGK